MTIYSYLRRSLRIVAESYAIKGLCLQKDENAPTKFKKAGKEDEINKCFSLASDLGLLYMQKIEKEQQNQNSVVTTMNTSKQTSLPSEIFISF